MRKKYLSALLFGALLFASAGTFTSCKDYDDDINNLQSQITANADAIKALQDLVNAGKYVSGVAMEGQTITFTFSDGSTQPITIPAGEKGQTVVVKDGELYIDDEATGIKVAEELDTEAGLVKSENGTWWVLNENGEYTNTNIPVSGITVSGSEKDGYTFTIYDEKGESQTVKLPSAVSSITEMTLGETTIQAKDTYINGVLEKGDYTPISAGTERGANKDEVLISSVKFDYTNLGDFKASDWMGNKKLPNDGDYIYSSPTSVSLRIDPVNVDAANIDFYLTNTKNADLSPVIFKAKASQDSSNNPMNDTQVNGRAAVTGNGLWTLTMENQTVASANHNATWDGIAKAESGEYVYAINANHGFRSKYELKATRIEAESLEQLSIKGVNADNPNNTVFIFDVDDTNANSGNITYKTGTAYTVNAIESSALYDMYLTADKSDIEVYGLTFDQDNHTFTIGKNPDVSSIPAKFKLIVYTVANDGTINKAETIININTEIKTNAEYATIDHSVNQQPADNNFYIDLSTMKTALGDNLNQWMQNVDLDANAISYALYSDATCQTEVKNVKFDGSAVFDAQIVAKNNKDAVETEDRNEANYIRINVNNAAVSIYNQNAANISKLSLDKTYYVKVNFVTTEGKELNTIVVPVEFHAPALSDLFTVNTAFLDKVDTDVINAFFYKVDGVIANGHQYTAAESGLTVNLDRYFSKFVSNAKVSFAEGKIGETGKTAAELFEWGCLNYEGANNTNINNGDQVFSTGVAGEVETSTTLGFNPNNNGIDNGKPANGYGETLTVNVNKGYYNVDETLPDGWRYTADGASKYSFKIRLMSPIYEGSVKPVEGSSITINANDLAIGASITKDMITGYDYNNNKFSAVPDASRGTRTLIYNTAGLNNVGAVDYVHPQIKSVIPGTNQYFENVEVWSAYTDKDAKKDIAGEFKVYGASISQTVTVDMPITVEDAWGYVLEEKVPVTITVNE